MQRLIDTIDLLEEAAIDDGKSLVAGEQLILERPEFAVAVVGETAGGYSTPCGKTSAGRVKFPRAPLGEVTAVGLRLVGGRFVSSPRRGRTSASHGWPEIRPTGMCLSELEPFHGP